MKAYIKEVDWADEGDIFFFSTGSEELLQSMKELIKIYSELNLLRDDIEMYWGTNEWFEFGVDDLLEFIDEAVDISDEELAVFRKFQVTGFDIYEEIFGLLKYALLSYDYDLKKDVIPDHLKQEDLDKIKPVFSKLFGQKEWDKVQQAFNYQKNDA